MNIRFNWWRVIGLACTDAVVLWVAPDNAPAWKTYLSVLLIAFCYPSVVRSRT